MVLALAAIVLIAGSGFCELDSDTTHTIGSHPCLALATGVDVAAVHGLLPSAAQLADLQALADDMISPSPTAPPPKA